jgi:hypothetical protein
MAAPNQSEIEAEIVGCTQSSQYPGKWELSLRLIQAKHISGPDMVTRQVGAEVTAITFDPPAPLESGQTVEAKAEYQGDARRGILQLFELHPATPK